MTGKRQKKKPRLRQNNRKKRRKSIPMLHRAQQKQHDHQKTRLCRQTRPPIRARPHSVIELVWRKMQQNSRTPNFGVHPAPQRSTRAPRQRVTIFLDRQWPRPCVYEISACVYSDVDEFIILSFSRWWRADGGRGTGCLDRVSPRRVRRLSRGRHAQGRRGVSLTVKSFAGWLLNALFFFRMKLLGIYHYLFF